MSDRPESAARQRVLTAAMALFGRQGFHATTVAQIEQAAGLTPGAGGLYRHVRSKRDLLAQGLRRQIDEGPSLLQLLETVRPFDELSMREQLLAIARAALARLDHERDLNRLLIRDLAHHPELLALVRDHELRSVHGALAGWLRSQRPRGVDAAALATVLMGAVSHYWLLTDVFAGEHPLTADVDGFLEAVVTVAEAVLRG